MACDWKGRRVNKSIWIVCCRSFVAIDVCFRKGISTCCKTVSFVPAVFRFYYLSIFMCLCVLAHVPGRLAEQHATLHFATLNVLFATWILINGGRREEPTLLNNYLTVNFVVFLVVCVRRLLPCGYFLMLHSRVFSNGALSILRFQDFRVFIFICEWPRTARIKHAPRRIQNSMLLCWQSGYWKLMCGWMGAPLL